MERSADLVTFWRRGRDYRNDQAYVEDEVRAECQARGLRARPRELSRRGTRDDDRAAFVVEDGATCRAWPGDADRSPGACSPYWQRRRRRSARRPLLNQT